jgi:hypothetical protein
MKEKRTLTIHKMCANRESDLLFPPLVDPSRHFAPRGSASENFLQGFLT